jgi:hypothetical protein
MLQGAGAAESSFAGEASAGSDAARTLQATAGGAVIDVAADPNGCLPGRVIGGPMSAGSAVGEAFQQSPGLRVRLVCGQRTVAIAAADSGGRFAFQNLPAGYYRAVVEGPGVPPNQSPCRVWAALAAPPRAGRGLDVSIAAVLPGTANASGQINAAGPLPVVRGQHPLLFPIMSLKQAATIGGIATGAIAAPIIYHNARMDNRGPASP